MNLIFAVILFVTLFSTGCTGDKGRELVYIELDHLCGIDSADKRAEFILACIDNANPKSDEEPEDWIDKCRVMAEKTLCPTVPVEVTKVCNSSSLGTCSWWVEKSRVEKSAGK